MSVERTVEDAGVVPIAWPRHFFECTPTLGMTPVLLDDAIDLAEAARRAALRAFGSVEPAVDADAEALH